MMSQNIGPRNAWLAVSAIGIAFLFSGCGAPEDRASVPQDKVATVVQEEPTSRGGLGGISDAVESGGYGAGVGPKRSVTVHLIEANGKRMVKPKRVSAGTIIVEPPSLDSPDNEFASLLAEVDRKLASLPSANIAFNTPETIPFGEAAVIELLVSLQEAEEELREAIRAAGPVESAKVKVSPYLEASLSGVGFSIEPVTPPRQLLSPTQRTQWRWNIEPTKAASLELTLTLSALFTVDGHQSTRAIQTFERTIAVEVPIVHRVTDLVTANKELLITLLLVPAAGWLYRHYRSAKTPSDNNQGDPPAVSRAA